MEGRALSVHMSTIRPLSIGKAVYQDTEASDSLSKIHGDSSTNLLRRHPHNGRFSGASCRAHRNSDKGLGVYRLRDKEEEVSLEANPGYPVSRFHCKFDKVCSISSKKCAHSQRGFKFLGSVPGCSASIADGSPALQGYSERLDSSNFSSRRQGKLQESHKFIGRCNQGSTLVDPRPCTSKWQGDYSSESRFSNFLRCFKDRMGSSSTTSQHRRMLERARSLRPYKLLGAESSISGSQSFSATDKGESCPVWPGQPHSSCIHQPVGRYKISTPHCIGSRHMVLCSRQEHGDISNSCSRQMELYSRWKVQNLSRFDRMHARWRSWPWFPTLLSMLIERPLLLPQGQRILRLPGTDKIHPLCCQKKFQLAAWKISGKACKAKVFRRKCQKFYYPPGEVAQPSNMRVLGKAGVACAVKKRLILFLQL